MNRKGMTALDPLLAPALELERLPVMEGRRDAVRVADSLVRSVDDLCALAEREGTQEGAQQLANAIEALCVICVSLVAYSRGRSPKLSSKRPNTNIIVQ